MGSFERHAQMYGLSRAGHIDDEIMRTLDRVGAGEEFREDAVEWELYDMRNKAFGGDLLMSLDWSVIGPHGYRGHWIFYQNNLELALNRQVEATGNVEINFSTSWSVRPGRRRRHCGPRRHPDDAPSAQSTCSPPTVRTASSASARYHDHRGFAGPNQLVIDTLQKRQLNSSSTMGSSPTRRPGLPVPARQGPPPVGVHSPGG